MVKGISVVLPAYNEEKNIAQMVRDCLKYLRKLKDGYEVIIVDDGSSDKTKTVAEKVAKRSKNVRLISYSPNRGYAQALKTGFEAAKFDYVFFTDSDRQFRLDALDIMYPIAKIKPVDLVIGYRLKRQDPFLRKFLSWGYNTLASFLFDLNVKDIDCAFKLFRKDIFKKIKIESEYFFFNTEILAKARFFNFNIIEVGVPHFPRTAGKSTIRFKYVPITIRELIRIKRNMAKLPGKRR
jgi:glycosyltransferase involved in cell wall biosynthesis